MGLLETKLYMFNIDSEASLFENHALGLGTTAFAAFWIAFHPNKLC